MRTLNDLRQSWARSKNGSVATEFAFIAPILLLLVFGIFGYGGFLGIAQSVQDAAGQAARAAVAGIDTDERIQLATETAKRAVASNPLLSTTNLTINAGPDPADTDRFLVTLSYDLSKTTVAVMPGFVAMPKTLTRTASVRRGGL